MTERELFLRYANEIKELGYKVFVCSNSNSSYGYIVDSSERIGYFQLNYGSLSFTTVHKPCRMCGTGFRVAEDVRVLTSDIINRCFINVPNWAINDSKYVIKYKNLEEFSIKHYSFDKLELI